MPYSAPALATVARRPGRSLLQRANGPRDGDGRVRASPPIVRRRPAHAPRHRRDGQPGLQPAQTRAASHPRRLAIGRYDVGRFVRVRQRRANARRRRTRSRRNSFLNAVADACGIDPSDCNSSMTRRHVERREQACCRQAYGPNCCSANERTSRCQSKQPAQRAPNGPCSPARSIPIHCGPQANGRDRGGETRAAQSRSNYRSRTSTSRRSTSSKLPTGSSNSQCPQRAADARAAVCRKGAACAGLHVRRRRRHDRPHRRSEVLRRRQHASATRRSPQSPTPAAAFSYSAALCNGKFQSLSDVRHSRRAARTVRRRCPNPNSAKTFRPPNCAARSLASQSQVQLYSDPVTQTSVYSR